MRHIFMLLGFLGSLFITPVHAISPIPSSGSCAFLITFPVPYGLVDVTSYAETGYNFLGVIAFSSSTTGTLSGTVENAVYKTNGSPSLGPAAYIKDATVAIAPMTDSNGFSGGSKLTVTGAAKIGSKSQQFTLVFNAVASNGGNTIMLQNSSPGPGPGSGVCQF